VREEKNLWIGRTYADAPDVDGVTYVRGAGLEAGDLAACTIVGTEGYDLLARADAIPPRRRRARPRPRKKPASPFTILN
jgi:ribosomal protein S12 methylthiotransferase